MAAHNGGGTIIIPAYIKFTEPLFLIFAFYLLIYFVSLMEALSPFSSSVIAHFCWVVDLLSSQYNARTIFNTIFTIITGGPPNYSQHGFFNPLPSTAPSSFLQPQTQQQQQQEQQQQQFSISSPQAQFHQTLWQAGNAFMAVLPHAHSAGLNIMNPHQRGPYSAGQQQYSTDFYAAPASYKASPGEFMQGYTVGLTASGALFLSFGLHLKKKKKRFAAFFWYYSLKGW